MKKTGGAALLLSAALLLTGCGGFFSTALEEAEIVGLNREETPEEPGITEGQLQQTVATEFYDFTVTEAWTSRYIGTSLPEDGNVYLMVMVTVKNTYRESIPLYDTDFQIRWDNGQSTADPLIGKGRFDYEWVLPISYELAPEEERSGLLIFEVPADQAEYTLYHVTVFSDETEGGTYRVTFEAPLRED